MSVTGVISLTGETGGRVDNYKQVLDTTITLIILGLQEEQV